MDQSAPLPLPPSRRTLSGFGLYRKARSDIRLAQGGYRTASPPWLRLAMTLFLHCPPEGYTISAVDDHNLLPCSLAPQNRHYRGNFAICSIHALESTAYTLDRYQYLPLFTYVLLTSLSTCRTASFSLCLHNSTTHVRRCAPSKALPLAWDYSHLLAGHLRWYFQSLRVLTTLHARRNPSIVMCRAQRNAKLRIHAIQASVPSFSISLRREIT